MEKYWTVGSIVALALFMSGLANATTTAPDPTPKNYLVYDQENASHVCLHMAAVLELVDVAVTNVSEVSVSDNGTLSSSSFCNSKTLNAVLVIIGGDDDGVYNLTFEFSGDLTQGNQHWSMDNIYLSLEHNNVSEPFSTTDKLYQASNARVEFTRSFKCDSNQTINFSHSNDTEIQPTLYVTHLQVQAFRFRNVTTGSFDNARVCLLDSQNKGNKIVPIAVGAALALLVIVVIVAYLIGRLWNRRKGSYETLN